MSDIEVIVDMPAEYSGMVFGQFDEYAREIERNLKVDLIARDGVVKLIGEKLLWTEPKEYLIILQNWQGVETR